MKLMKERDIYLEIIIKEINVKHDFFISEKLTHMKT